MGNDESNGRLTTVTAHCCAAISTEAAATRSARRRRRASRQAAVAPCEASDDGPGRSSGFWTSFVSSEIVAGDLLGEFTLSTKIGLFPNGDPVGCALHSLEIARLREAVERSVEDLGRTPDVVFLHSPERTLAGLPVSEGHCQLAAACEALAEAVVTGLCGAWSIASWDPRPVVAVIDEDSPGIQPGVLSSGRVCRWRTPCSARESGCAACSLSPPTGGGAPSHEHRPARRRAMSALKVCDQFGR